MSDPRPGAHSLSDAALVRYLDGELSEDEARRMEEALEVDDEGRRRLQRLRADSALLGEALGAIVVPPTPAWRDASKSGSPAWRRAAAVALLGGSLLAATVPSVRAAVVDGVRQLSALLGVEMGEAPAPTRDDGAGETSVSFAAPGPELVVELERAEPASLTVIRADGSRATVRSSGGSVELRIGPEGLTVLNASADAGGLELVLPATVERLRIRIGDADPRVVVLGADEGPLEIPLDPDVEIDDLRS